MIEKCKTDGALNALSGYKYQFDKTILEILNNDSSVYFECVEDINYQDKVIQVKKWSKKYSKSLIKKAVLNLYDTYSNDNNLIPILFGFVSENDNTRDKINKDIEEILIKNKKLNFSDFIQKIVIDLSSENSADSIFKNTIDKIKNEFKIYNEDIAKNYYSNIIMEILEHIIYNKDNKKRSLKKSDLIKKIKEKTKNCFNSLFCEFMTEEKYIKYIKKEHFAETNKSNCERLFVFDLEEDNIEKLFGLSNLIINNYNQHIDFDDRRKKYKKHFSIESSVFYCPWIYFKNIKEDNLVKLKSRFLLEKPYYIIDGFPYQNSTFNYNFFFAEDPFCNLKIINNFDIYKKFLNHNFTKSKKIFYFYDKDSLNNHENNENIVKIYVKNLEFINKMV